MNLPLVSIIVPVYNSVNFVNKNIFSILNQTYKNIEIIIVNDGSTDNSDEKIKNLFSFDERIIYLKQNNKGPSAARNTGIDNSRGEFIMFVDSDDTVEKDYVERLITTAINFDFDIVSCGYTDISIHGSININHFWHGEIKVPKDQFIMNIFNGVGGTLWGKIFKKEIINKQNLRMNPEIFMCEDLVFVLQYSMYCSRHGSIKDSLYNYNRLNENSISTKINIRYLENLIRVIREIEKILKFNGFDENKLDKILTKRVQSLIESFIVLQHNSNYSKSEKMNNIEFLSSNNYYKKYKKQLLPSSFTSKVILTLIRNDYRTFIYYYSLLACRTRQMKDNFKIRLNKNKIYEKKLIFEEESY